MSDDFVVLDVGSSTVKGGRVSDSLPSVVMPTVAGSAPKKVSVLKKKAGDDVMNGKQFLVGHDAIANVGRVTLDYPVENGVVKNWNQMEHIVSQCLEDMEADLSQDGVVLTQPSFHPLANSETFAQLMFETFDACSVAFVVQGACALYASGRTTGIVLESGDGITQVLPIFESAIINTSANRLNWGGRDVTDHLSRILFERGYCFTGPADKFTVQKIKEELCEVSENYSKMMEGEEELSDPFFLPDGQSITVGKEKYRAPEILFEPSIIASELPSMAALVGNSLKTCPVDLRPGLMSNIVLSGGNTLFEGFADRLKEGVRDMFPGFHGVNVIDAPDRKYSVWAGASVLAGLSSFKSSVITKEEYDEHGPSIVHNYQRTIDPQAENDDEEDIPPPPPDDDE